MTSLDAVRQARSWHLQGAGAIATRAVVSFVGMRISQNAITPIVTGLVLVFLTFAMHIQSLLRAFASRFCFTHDKPLFFPLGVGFVHHLRILNSGDREIANKKGSVFASVQARKACSLATWSSLVPAIIGFVISISTSTAYQSDSAEGLRVEILR